MGSSRSSNRGSAPVDELVADLLARSQDVLCVGDGALRYREEILDGFHCEIGDEPTRRPAPLVQLAHARALREEWVKPRGDRADLPAGARREDQLDDEGVAAVSEVSVIERAAAARRPRRRRRAGRSTPMRRRTCVPGIARHRGGESTRGRGRRVSSRASSTRCGRARHYVVARRRRARSSATPGCGSSPARPTSRTSRCARDTRRDGVGDRADAGARRRGDRARRVPRGRWRSGRRAPAPRSCTAGSGSPRRACASATTRTPRTRS